MGGRSTLFIKYILSYIAILAIPILVLAAIMYQGMIYNLKKDTDTRMLAEMQRITKLIDTEFDDLKMISNKIMNDPQLTRYMFTSSEVNQMEAARALKRYCNYNKEEQILIYYKGDPIVYSTEGMASVSAATKSSYMKESWDSERFYKALNESSMAYLDTGPSETANDGKSYRWFNFICPMTSSSGTEYGKIIFTVKSNLFGRYLADQNNSIVKSVFVLDSASRLFFEENNRNLTPSEIEMISEISKQGQSESNIYEKKIDGEDMVIISTRSQNYGWTFHVVFSSFQYYQNYNKSILRALGIFCIVVTAVLILAFVLSKRNYEQIKKLLEFMKAKFSDITFSDRTKQDELYIIRLAMENAANRVIDLQEKVEMLEARSTNELLLKFLHNEDDFQGEISLEELFERSRIKRTFSRYFILLVSFIQKPNLPREAIVYFLREAIMVEGTELCFVDMTPEQTVSVIVSTNNESSNIKREIASKLCNLLESKTNSEVVITAGGSYKTPDELPLSFREAAISFHYKSEFEKEKILLYDDLMNTGSVLWWYPDKQILLLNKCILAADYGKMEDVIKELDRIIFTALFSISSRKSVLFEIFNTLIKLAVKFNVPIQFNEIDSLLLSEDSKRFVSNVTGFCYKIADTLVKNREFESAQLTRSILKYTGENFTDPNFSLVSVALHFNLSLSYLSRLFKDESGMTFTDYLIKLRNDRCKYLLVNTDKPVKDIVYEIGYLDASNFIRKFRALESMTPGKYRETMRNA